MIILKTFSVLLKLTVYGLFLIAYYLVYRFFNLAVNPLFFLAFLSLGPLWSIAIFEDHFSTFLFYSFVLTTTLLLWPQPQIYTLSGCFSFFILWLITFLVYSGTEIMIEMIKLYAGFDCCDEF